MKKVVALVPFYQDKEAGCRLLKYFDHLDIPSIWGDGRVEGFPKLNDSDFSTDGLPEIITSYKNTALVNVGLSNPQAEYQKPPMFEAAAKAGFEYCLMMACDEYITGDWDLMESNLERFNFGLRPGRLLVPFSEENLKANPIGPRNVVERLYYKPDKIFRRYAHWAYFYKLGLLELPLFSEVVPVFGITIHHDDSVRPTWRNELMDQYQKEKIEKEQNSYLSHDSSF